MTIVQHKNIDNSQLHEPKDISLAVANKVYVSDGLGSGSWQYAIAHGGVSFINEASPFVIPAPNTYIKLAPVTTPQTSAIEFTEGTDCSLTYTGIKQRVAVIHADVCLSETSTSAFRNASLAIYRNGVLLPFTFASGNLPAYISTDRVQIHCSVKTSAVANDKFEVYIKTGVATNVELHSIQLTALAYL